MEESSLYTSGAKYYYHHDRQYNVIGISSVDTGADSDAYGDVIELYDYTTYGVVNVTTVTDNDGTLISTGTQGASSVGNPYEFTGRRKDAETGLYYFRARYYDAE